jgi:glycerophosphoryl diester phosphodiesterase
VVDERTAAPDPTGPGAGEPGARARAADPLVLAHRGARTVAPENTVEAFRVALELGADGVELDVHRTADDGLVVHHDAEAPGLGVLAELERDAIRSQRPDIPSLDEVLEVCAGTLVNIEIKNAATDADFDDTHRAAALVVELLDARDHRDDVLVSSFNLATIDRVRELHPTVPTGFLVFAGIDVIDALALAVEHGHGAVHPFRALLGPESGAEIVDRADALGVALNVWTVNEEAEISWFADLGVRAVITDLPDVARRVIDGGAAAPR